MTEIKAIKTTADGIQFRSRLEATWYLYLKKLGFNPVYEPEVFEITDANGVTRDFYCPDFYLDGHDTYVEIKASRKEYSDHDKKSMHNAYMLGYRVPTILVLGLPENYLAIEVNRKHKGNPDGMRVAFDNEPKVWTKWSVTLSNDRPDECGVETWTDPREYTGCALRKSWFQDEAKQAWNETAYRM